MSDGCYDSIENRFPKELVKAILLIWGPSQGNSASVSVNTTGLFMISTVINTDSAYVDTFLRIIAGIIVLPYGLQKLVGWPGTPEFGPKGISDTIAQITAKNIPQPVAWLTIIGQSFGSIALLVGFFGRIAAGGLFIIFTGALIVHLPDGWTINWFGSKKGEGIEYFVLLLAVLSVIVLKGSGALSIDHWLAG